MPASTIVTSRWGPPRKRATSSSGFWVALRPIRCRPAPGLQLQALERQRQVRAALGGGDGVDLVDDHRLGPRRASLRAWEVRIRYRDSGVVTRMSGGLRAIAARSRSEM